MNKDFTSVIEDYMAGIQNQLDINGRMSIYMPGRNSGLAYGEMREVSFDAASGQKTYVYQPWHGLTLSETGTVPESPLFIVSKKNDLGNIFFESKKYDNLRQMLEDIYRFYDKEDDNG